MRENRRPADYQIRQHYTCGNCERQIEVAHDQTAVRCHCGGTYKYSGESYPASSDDWDEERDDVSSQWRQRR